MSWSGEGRHANGRGPGEGGVNLVRVMCELEGWEVAEGRVLPRAGESIAYSEGHGVITDLVDGSMFVQRDSWVDFGARWWREMERRGEEPSCERLAKAIYRAQNGVWSLSFCSSVASRVLEVGRERGYTALPA